MQEVPQQIKNFFANRRLDPITLNLVAKYKLRIDQAAVLEREIILLLLGLEDPGEFVRTLGDEAKLDQATIQGITQDVNAQIFVPLREEMEGKRPPQPPPAPAPPPQLGKSDFPKPTPPPAPPKATQGMAPVMPPRMTVIPANPQMPARPPETVVPMPRYMSPKQPPLNRAASDAARSEKAPSGDKSHFHLINKIPLPSSQPLPKTDPSRLLEDHEEPHIEFKKQGPPPLNGSRSESLGDHSAERNGLASPQLPQKPPTPPPNLPGAMPPPPPPARAPSGPKTPPPSPHSYTNDPYREPLDEENMR